MAEVRITQTAPAVVRITGTGGEIIKLAAQAPAVVKVIAAGTQGVQGDPGAPMRFDVSAAGTWTIVHGLGRAPQVQAFLASGEQIQTDIFVDAVHIVVIFASPTAGFVLAS